MFEALKTELETSCIDDELTEFDICIAESDMEESISCTLQDISKEDLLGEFISLRNKIANSENQMAALEVSKESLEHIGIDCSSSEAAIVGMDNIIKECEPAAENYVAWAGIVTILILDLIFTYMMLSNAAVWLRKVVGRLSTKHIGEPDEKKYNKATNIVLAKDFNRVMPAITKAMDVLRTDSLQKKVGSSTFNTMEKILKPVGIALDEKGSITKQSFMDLKPAASSVKGAGWTKSNITSGLTDLVKLSKVLEQFSDVAYQAEKQKTAIDKAKSAGSGDKTKVKEDVSKERAAGKKIKRTGKDLLNLVKVYTKSYQKAFYVFVD